MKLSLPRLGPCGPLDRKLGLKEFSHTRKR